METGKAAQRLSGDGGRYDLSPELKEGVALWFTMAGYAEIKDICELIREEIARRGQTFTWSITWPVVPGGKAESDGG